MWRRQSQNVEFCDDHFAKKDGVVRTWVPENSRKKKMSRWKVALQPYEKEWKHKLPKNWTESK